MISNAVLSFFSGVASFVLSPLSIIDVAIDLLSSIPVVAKFLMFVVYVIPWNNLVPLMFLVFTLLGLRVVIALIKFIWKFIPIIGN